MKKRRSPIHWKGATAHERPPAPQPERTPSWFQARPEVLTVGAVFTPADSPLGHLHNQGARSTPPVLTRLFYWFGPTAVNDLIIVPLGGMLIYAGTVRINTKHDNRVFSRLKHTFVHGSGRYIIDDLDYIKQVLW